MVSAGAPAHAGFDVAVVGTGVAGLATALGCAQRGLKVALIGRAPVARRPAAAAPFDLRIYALAPVAIGLLEALHVWPQVDPLRVQNVARMRIWGDQGAELSFDAYAAALERLAVIIEEAELARVLASACRFTPGIQFVEGQVEGLAGASGERATLRLTAGAALSHVAAQLVVGADGAGSFVRAAAGINAAARAYDQTAVVANFACTRPHLGRALQWFTADEGIVALLPLPGDAVSLVWSAPTGLAVELAALPPAALAERVTARTAGAAGTLSAMGPVGTFALRLVKVDRIVAPRLALVGDAAHVVHPLAGQGLNLGLQDVSELLAAIGGREAWRDPGDPVVLRRYERARAEPVGLMRMTTDGLARLFGREELTVKLLRNAGMGLVNAIGPLKGALIRHAVGRL